MHDYLVERINIVFWAKRDRFCLLPKSLLIIFIGGMLKVEDIILLRLI